MGERNIQGTVQEWDKIETGAKTDGSLWHKAKVKLAEHKERFSFFCGTVEEAYSLVTKTTPGTIINFQQWQPEGGMYWNFKKGTLKVVGKGAVPPPAPSYKPNYAPKQAQGGKIPYTPSNGERDPGMNARTALMQAREMVCYNKIPADKLQETAEMYKLWLDTGKWVNDGFVGETDLDTMQDEIETEISEESLM